MRSATSESADRRLADRVIVVTGAASGIGRATVDVLIATGARLVLADLPSAPRLGELRALERERPVLVVPTDVTDAAQCAALAAAGEERFGQIDALVNCAGILRGAWAPVDRLGEDVFRSVVDVNLVGSFLCCRAVVPALRRAGGGVIVLIASGAGVAGPSSSLAYGASKGAVHGFAMTLAARLAPEGIRVNDVCPGSIDTPLKRENVADTARAQGRPVEEALREADAALGDPLGVARVLAFLVSDDADYVRGTIFTR